MNDLGIYYLCGDGVQTDPAQSFDWFQRAAQAGSLTAMVNLAKFYATGIGTAQDYAMAAYWFQKAAEAGSADGMYNLGIYYGKGQGVEQDYGKAFYWYQKAAEAGRADAMHNLGVFYDEGQGVAQNYGEAVHWYKKAAEAGVALSMFNLGIKYEKGKGVAQDRAEAFRWFQKGAEWGDVRSMIKLGVRYAQGVVVPRDDNEALHWFQRAFQESDEQSIKKAAQDGIQLLQNIQQQLRQQQSSKEESGGRSGFDAAYADMLEKYAYAQKVAQDGNTPDFTVLGAIRVCLEQGLKASAALFHADINSYDNKLKDCIDDISRRGYASKDSIDILHKLRMLGNKGAHADEIKPWDMRNAREFLPRLPDIFREIYGAIPGASNRSGQRQSGAGAEKHQSTQQESTRICSKCAKINKSQDNFCIRCGNALASTSGYSLHEQVEAFKRISADDLRQWIYDRAREITITGFEGGLYLDEGVHGEDPSIIVQNLQIRYREQPTNGQYVLLYTASTDSFWKPARYRAIDKMYKRMQEDEYGRKAQSVKTLKREFNFMGGPFYMAVLLIWIPDETE